MKKNLKKNLLIAPLLLAGALLAVIPAQAVNYAGNGNTSFGGDIGNGVLNLSDDGTNIYGSLVVGNGNNMYNTLVIYIDTGVGGGFTTTTNFNDQNDGNRIAISGVQDGQGRSVLTFTNGFAPQYAIALGPNTTSFGGLWQLANGGNNSLPYISSANLSPVGTSSGPFTFSVKAADLGLANNTPATIKIFGTYISGSAYRSGEAIAGNDFSTFGAGWKPFMQTAYATYNFDAPPAPSYPVGFQVDMTEQIATGAFNPNNGDKVYAAGTFQTNAWAGQSFQLTPTVANTNIYTGTYLDSNPTNTAEQFKFAFTTSMATNFETLDNRPFTLNAPGVTNALVYFDDVFPTNNSATTNYVSFSIDMTPQIALGHFNPGNGDQIQALGTFENPKWTIGGLVLTNDPSSAQSNVYSGTIADGNYPGSFENYKFVIHTTSSGDTYENGNNRNFFTPTNAGTLPLAYFNNVFSIYEIPVTFQVDMTVPLLTGAFNPGNGDTVSAAGTFQTNQWTPGAFVLTNNPAAANPNVYSGTYVDYDAPGTGETYKFVIVSGGVNNYESIGDRSFLLADTAQTLPVVNWNNSDANNILLVPTTVTFTVNMTNAVDVFGYPFDPSADVVVVNGDFLNPQWPDFWTDALLGGFDYTANVLQNNGQNLLYTGTFTVPAGNSLEVQYKYGIIHGYTGTANTNCDNEASFGKNHTRWIRSAGTYSFPTDIFGIQRTNLPAATEPSFGSLVIGSPATGNLPINWLGRPGVHLQYTTNLAGGVWVDLNATDGTNAYMAPQTNAAAFFRLVNP